MENQRLAQALRVAQLIAVGFLSSVLACGAAAAFVLQQRSPTAPPAMPPDALATLRAVLYLVAVGAQAGAVVVGRALAAGKAPVSADELANALTVRTIIGLAFSEAPGLFGFVLAVLSGTARDLVLLGGFAIALIALRWPTEHGWRQVARASGLDG